jgi:hypothetical protein
MRPPTAPSESTGANIVVVERPPAPRNRASETRRRSAGRANGEFRTYRGLVPRHEVAAANCARPGSTRALPTRRGFAVDTYTRLRPFSLYIDALFARASANMRCTEFAGDAFITRQGDAMADDSYLDDDDRDDGLIGQAAEAVGSTIGAATRTVVGAAQTATGAATSAAAAAADAAATAVEQTAKPRRAASRVVKKVRRRTTAIVRRAAKATRARGAASKAAPKKGTRKSAAKGRSAAARPAARGASASRKGTKARGGRKKR